MRDERRHAAQRRLLLGQTPELVPRLRLRERGRHELGEPRQPLLDAIGQRSALRGRHDHAPQRAVDDDRRAGRRTDPGAPDGVGERTRDLRVVVGPRGRAGLAHPRSDCRAVKGPARPDFERMLALAPGTDHRRRPIGLVSQHVDVWQAERPADLLGHRGEHVRRAGAAGDHPRHAAQRRLLLGEDRVALAQLVGTVEVAAGHRRRVGEADRAVSVHGEPSLRPRCASGSGEQQGTRERHDGRRSPRPLTPRCERRLRSGARLARRRRQAARDSASAPLSFHRGRSHSEVACRQMAGHAP